MLFFTNIFMPDTAKARDEMGAWQYSLLLGSSIAIALITYGILARFLSAKAWEWSGKFLALWLLLLIGFALMLRFFA